MSNYVLVWDLETIPDLSCVARVNGLTDGDDDGARAALGEKFPKLPFHQIACIGALVTERINGVHRISQSAVSPSCCSPLWIGSTRSSRRW